MKTSSFTRLSNSERWSGYQFDKIAVFKTDKAGYYNVNIPDDLQRFIPTPIPKGGMIGIAYY